MSSEMNADRDGRIDGYLDGQMSAAEREAFERELESDARLREMVERQGAIDGSLSRLFAPPQADRVVARAKAAREGSGAVQVGSRKGGARRARPRLVRRGLAAAVIAMVGVGGWLVWQTWLAPEEIEFGHPPWRSLTTVYYDSIKDGFQPEWVCETDEEFEQTFAYKLRERLHLHDVPEEIQAVGLSYCNSITVDTVYLLARVRGTEVIVFVDRAENDGGQTLGPESELNLFRDRVGDLVLYELTPLDEPYVTEYLDVP